MELRCRVGCQTETNLFKFKPLRFDFHTVMKWAETSSYLWVQTAALSMFDVQPVSWRIQSKRVSLNASNYVKHKHRHCHKYSGAVKTALTSDNLQPIWTYTRIKCRSVTLGHLQAHSKEPPFCVGVAYWSHYKHSHTAVSAKAHVDFTVVDTASIPDAWFLKSLIGWIMQPHEGEGAEGVVFSLPKQLNFAQHDALQRRASKSLQFPPKHRDRPCTPRFACSGHVLRMYIHTHLFMHAGFGGASRGFSVFLETLYK